ncbi:MAG: hypothetical protein VZR27_08085 [Acutalibacteraceae bacterium]|nr:hypothetical protein [Clostridia bacterium]MBQ2603944.1 hypothetical protein [Clostridia bacterium]MEE3450640.1 hypothetical protein [Acutalibacteraceae bacterium]
MNRNNNNLDNLAQQAGRQLNISPEQLKKSAQSGDMKSILNTMTDAQAAQVQNILNDKNALNQLLSSPQAKALLKGLQKK